MAPRLILYNFIILMTAIIALPWVVYQLVFVRKRRRGLAQRLGFLPGAQGKTIWCHAVSVGEVRAVGPMLSLLEDNERSSGRVVLSTVTVTGQETANRECNFVNRIFYFPLDLPFIVHRAIRRVNPEIFITAETEIWPNFFSLCFSRNIPVVVVNGRISDRSFSRYLRFRWFFRPILQRVRLFLMQSEVDARRILELGAMPETVKITGNMKYDRAPEPVLLAEDIRQWAESNFLLVAGSTHAGEEEVLLDALDDIGDDEIRLALVPRHPERFEEVAGILGQRGVPYARYSDFTAGGGAGCGIILVDAMGVLEGFYARGAMAFVGGSLVPVGGHNLLEPAAHGLPVLTGPNVQNFRDISQHLSSAGACVIVSNRDELAREVVRLKNNPQVRADMGQKAMDAAKALEGASMDNASRLLQLI